MTTKKYGSNKNMGSDKIRVMLSVFDCLSDESGSGSRAACFLAPLKYA
jgi:hypothetical protein